LIQIETGVVRWDRFDEKWNEQGGKKKTKKTKKFENQKQYRRLDWKMYTVPSCIVVTGKVGTLPPLASGAPGTASQKTLANKKITFFHTNKYGNVK
jgi:hypothetical protein